MKIRSGSKNGTGFHALILQLLDHELVRASAKRIDRFILHPRHLHGYNQLLRFLVSPIFMYPERVPAVAHVVALIAVVLNLEVFSLDMIDHVVSVLAGISTLETSILSG